MKRGKLVWEGVNGVGVKTSQWQCYAEARVDGSGSVVATVSRRMMPNTELHAGGRVILVRLRGKIIGQDWTSRWWDSNAFENGKRLAELHYREESHHAYVTV